MRKLLSTFSLLFILLSQVLSQNGVTQKEMQAIYSQVKTPYKYGLVLAPTNNHHKIDCPTIFRERGKWYMSYLVYNGKSGKDGRGYETWLASSDNLLTWKTLGRILSYPTTNTWDINQRAGYVSLIDFQWGGNYEAQKYNNKHWLSYFGGNTAGYEQGMLKEGIAYTEGDITKAHEWTVLRNPVLSPNDKNHGWWESITQYKPTVIWDHKKTLKYPFVMFYNAAGIDPNTKVKAERIGIALSNDMIHWKRFKGNPVINHNEGITGDGVIQQIGNMYIMFYFSAFRKNRSYKAFNTFACSRDLLHWTDWDGADLIIPSEKYDNLFAHKSCVIYWKGIVYHFYCAVNEFNQRGIAVATSQPQGSSLVRFPKPDKDTYRKEIPLNNKWYSVENDSDSTTYNGFESVKYNCKDWKQIDIPHNWDSYGGARRLKHGNMHGYAWYRKEFTIKNEGLNKKYFLYFEGVGSYATVYLNGKEVGTHAGGRTTFTLNITDYIHFNTPNVLAVRADHPAMITNLPWVCGGCSSEVGFSEGSQPLGIFRPVTLVITNALRIQPFGVHVWNNVPENEANPALNFHVDTEMKNYSDSAKTIDLIQKLVDKDGLQVERIISTVHLKPNEIKTIHQRSKDLEGLKLWDTKNPYLYKLITMIKVRGELVDEVYTPYGFRWISWPVNHSKNHGQFYLNGKPVFINGVCEYEHLLGQSHAFADDQIVERIRQIKSAGFNALRVAHQPHNLLYLDECDQNGILFWAQFSAHIWYDTPEFKENFKSNLIEWIKERRNNPAVILWGLQNESALPTYFAQECTSIVRQMDPTSPTQRLTTTCNGGSGTDWNVLQNWSGTYGGNLNNYGEELKRQLLNGEYGAWRSLGLHTEGVFAEKGPLSEDRMCDLLETKIRLAESVKDSICGQFMWLYNSHDNPGRVQNEEGSRDIDRVGPFNYKGLFTPWEEPLDAYYLYRSNYVSKDKEPMVYIVSHTWSNRWNSSGFKNGIKVYSNCDEVELFNDVQYESLGRMKNKGVGTHFEWNHVNIKYNVLYAIGYVRGKAVAKDYIVLNNLPQAPHESQLYSYLENVTVPQPNYNYLYRVNCGGDTYTDEYNNTWLADTHKNATTDWGSLSWTDAFGNLPPFLASQQSTSDPIAGTKDWPLFQSFRYGRNLLSFHFPISNGKYLVELYFIEPWYGTGGGGNCEGYRRFDVCINDSTVLKDLDIWKEVGHDRLLKKTVEATVSNNELVIKFPRTTVGQAIISAIAIASAKNKIHINAHVASIVNNLKGGKLHHWFNSSESLPAQLYGADWIQADSNSQAVTFITTNNVDIYSKQDAEYSKRSFRKNAFVKLEGGRKYVLIPEIVWKKEERDRPVIQYSINKVSNILHGITWTISPGLAGEYALRFRFMNTSARPVNLNLSITDSDNRIMRNDTIQFPITLKKWKTLNTTTGVYINAGNYCVTVSGSDVNEITFGRLDMQ